MTSVVAVWKNIFDSNKRAFNAKTRAYEAWALSRASKGKIVLRVCPYTALGFDQLQCTQCKLTPVSKEHLQDPDAFFCVGGPRQEVMCSKKCARTSHLNDATSTFEEQEKKEKLIMKRHWNFCEKLLSSPGTQEQQNKRYIITSYHFMASRALPPSLRTSSILEYMDEAIGTPEGLEKLYQEILQIQQDHYKGKKNAYSRLCEAFEGIMTRNIEEEDPEVTMPLEPQLTEDENSEDERSRCFW